MKRFLLLATSLFILTCFAGCTFLANSKKFNTTTKLFIESLLHRDYDKCIDLLAFDPANPPNRDSVKSGLENFRNIIVRNFGDKLEYSFIKAEKNYSTDKEKSTPPNATLLYVQYDNNADFGIIQGLFDDKTGKILNIKTLDIKEKIPSMLPYWLFGIVAICIPAFNIYTIVKVKRSNMKRKWLKYIAIFLLNVPAITYGAIQGLTIKYLNFQILLGLSFNYSSYSDSYWTFGIPIGGLIVFLKLKSGMYKSSNAVLPPGDEIATETVTES